MLISDMTELAKGITISNEDLAVDYQADETINTAFIRKIESSGMSMAEFSRKSGLSKKTIVRYRHNLSEPSLETIVILCIVLRTNVFESLYLISKGGYNIFCSDNKKVYLLLVFLSRYCGIGVNEANQILKSLDMKPLNKRKYYRHG